MPRIKSMLWLPIVVLTLGVELLAAANTTYVVGNCRPGFPTFFTISAALASTPAPTVVQVCPGTYNEQITITQGVTLEGISNGDSNQAVIAPPAGGLTQTANGFLGTIAFQIWVNNASGPVNISNLVIDGTGNGVPTGGDFVNIVGVFYLNSPGTVNHVTARNQNGNNQGLGFELEGGSSNPSVSVENSSVQNFDLGGISAQNSSLTAAIKSNNVSTTSSVCGINCAAFGITAGLATATTITGNFISLTGTFSDVAGIAAGTDTGSISGNTVTNSGEDGILLNSAVIPVTSNKILNVRAGIEFVCFANPNVRSNTIMNANIGVKGVPSLLVSPNTYFGVGTIRTGGC